LEKLCHSIFLPIKLAVSLKFSYNTPISFSGELNVFKKYYKKQIVRKTPENNTCKE